MLIEKKSGEKRKSLIVKPLDISNIYIDNENGTMSNNKVTRFGFIKENLITGEKKFKGFIDQRLSGVYKHYEID